MRKFGERFRQIAARDLVYFTIDRPEAHLPVKDYWVVEYYCDEPGCDCRRVALDVLGQGYKDRIFATIIFGWEKPAFYRKWAGTRDLGEPLLQKGALDYTVLNCDWADLLLRHVRKHILKDPKALARFKRHYALVKREQRKQARSR